MAANKEKQNLRFKKISQRLHNKVRYDGFSQDEITIIKTKKKLDQAEKELSYFWANAPRMNNNNVDWDRMTEQELDHFEYIYKQQERLLKKMSKFEDKGFKIDKILNLFMKLNITSASY
jgi:hypothetical protein